MNCGNQLNSQSKEAASALTRRRFLQGVTAVGAGSLAACRAVPRRLSGKRKPNLLFVFSDQQAYDMLGCYGNEQIITPRIDSFASEGIRFSQCISHHPACTPHRSMLLSGLHPLYNGCINNDIQMLPSPSYLAPVLKREGYRTGYIGKWHLLGGSDRNRPIPPGPLRYGFDDVFLSDNCTSDYSAKNSFYWNDAGEKVFFDEADGWQVVSQTKQAMRFLEENPSDQPFCLFVSWHPPHIHSKESYATLPRLMEQYDPAKIKPRPNCPADAFNREWYHGHMAMCTGIDEAFGMLMDKLREKGLEDDTIVVYTSDHGDLLRSHGYPASMHKAMPHEESARVPLIVRLPDGLRAGTTSDLMVGTLDFMPTLLGLMGVAVPDTCQGENLAPAIFAGAEQAKSEYQPMWHYWIPPSQRNFNNIAPDGWRGVRTYQYTYARAVGRGPWLLYDNLRDPRQMNNLIDKPEYQTLRRHLDQQTSDWMEQFGDPGWTGDRLLSTCIGQGGLPKGRPIDAIRAAAES